MKLILMQCVIHDGLLTLLNIKILSIVIFGQMVIHEIVFFEYVRIISGI